MASEGSSPILIDLFCGAGGLSTGLEDAGFSAVAAVDYDPHSLSSYSANHPGATCILKDIAKVRASELAKTAGGREIELIAGGPSCQGYSTHGKRVEDDPRNFLFKHFVRLVAELQPRFVLLENVKGLLTFRSGYFRELIEQSFDRAGYRMTSKVVCAADYGVPQLRERIVFLGTRLSGVELSFPSPTHGPSESLEKESYVTVDEAIGDLPLLKGHLDQTRWEYAHAARTEFQRYARRGVRSKYISLHQANGVSDAALQVVKLVGEGQGLRSIAPALLPDRFKRMRRISDGSLRKDCTTLYHRLSRSKPAYTITCFFRNVASGPFVHPLENRSLSYREAARLMSFRDVYEFCGSLLPRQIGNAVPPLLAKAIGEHLRMLSRDAERQKRSSRRLSLAV